MSSLGQKKKRKDNSFVGARGVYIVAAMLSKYNIHVAQTVGNAPLVDLIATLEDGRKSVAIQVKTAGAGHATRRRRHCGKNVDGKYWVIGNRAGAWSDDFWYALVDLDDDKHVSDVYFVPSKWIAAFCMGIKNMPFFFLEEKYASKMQNNAELLYACLSGKKTQPKIPDDKIWVGDNSAMTTKQIIATLK